MDELQRANEIASSFNYAVLSAEMGDYLKRKEQQLKNEYMNFTANCGAIFAEAQEELAKHGFGDNNGMFEKWIESMGFAKRTVYRMIQIYNYRSCQIGTNEGTAFFDALPKTLQADISAPSAPPQLVEQVMNGNITTHKEYIKLKKELDESKSQIENLTKNLENEQDKLKDVVSRYDGRIANIVKSNEAKVNELENQIKALESRPVEATYTSLDDCFDTPAGTDDTEKFTSFYETLNHNVLSGIYDCVDFIMNTNLPKDARHYARERLRSIQGELENQMMLIEEEF